MLVYIKVKRYKMDSSIYGVDENGNAAVRVTKNAATTTDPTSIYGIDENGNAAMRVMGDIGGGRGKSVLVYKGSVATWDDLPKTGNEIGDVWNILDTGENVAWDGEKWDKFGTAIDTSVFLTKTDAATTYSTKEELNDRVVLTIKNWEE